jgi:protein involved in polysaccharide export with SLBB domain
MISPGDAVRIEVWRRPELSGQFTVAADSTIRHPLYRNVKIAGVSLPTAVLRVHNFLTQFDAEPQFVLEPLLNVYVGGEARQPRLYTLPPEVSIAQAVAMAGGPTERGRTDRAQLVRNGRVEFVSLDDPNSSLAGTPVQSGDRILIERQRSLFRDYIAPILTTTGAAAAILNVILINSR